MANNTPITARINKGLFGKSSLKVTEPLLNVGPAGVSGNNQTKDIPSPSKMKSAFKMMTSPFKQKKTDSKAKTYFGYGGTEEQKEAVVPAAEPKAAGAALTVDKPKMSNKAWTEYLASETPEKKTKRLARQAAEKTAKTPTPVTTITPKPDAPELAKDTPGELYSGSLYMRDKGDAQTALDRRDVIRAGIVSARKEKRADIKVARIENKGDKAGFKAAKETAKLKQAITNQEVAKGQTEGAKAQSAQNIKGSSTSKVYGKEREVAKGDQSEATQIAAQKAEIEARRLAGPDAKVINVGAPVGIDVSKVEEVKTTTNKKDNGFFTKKSPMKLKYFK